MQFEKDVKVDPVSKGFGHVYHPQTNQPLICTNSVNRYLCLGKSVEERNIGSVTLVFIRH